MHAIQSFLLPRAGFPRKLYFRSTGTVAIVPASDGTTPEVLVLDDGAKISTDTFFGALYLSYWVKYTSVRDIQLVVRLKGSAVVQIVDTTDWGEEVVIQKSISSTTLQDHKISLPELSETHPFNGQGPHRRHVTIKAAGECTVAGMLFSTQSAPKRKLSLSIGLCTFNQEKMFARTLERLASLVENTDSIHAIHVVNQGQPFASDKIRNLLQKPKFRCTEQRNLGGCGGFTRTIFDALASDEPVTHHLLMDDDIVLDERMIGRAIQFLEHMTAPYALGAPMIDALRPTTMYEAGAFIRHDNRLQPYCHNVDLTRKGALAHFDKPVNTDYNAWWFCILPLEQCRDVRLPAPIFIRGDDFEYGQRLAAAGVPTLTLPSIAVWHEPFYAKPSGWQDYYDLRNRLIFGATYPSRVSQLSVAHVTGLVTTSILNHNYLSAELRLRAIEDFLAGPDATLSRDTEDLHQEIMAIAKTNAPERLESAAWKARDPIIGAPLKTGNMRELIVEQLASLAVTGLGPLRRSDDPVFMDIAVRPATVRGRGYVLTNGPRTFHLRYRPERKRMWSLMLRTAGLAVKYRRKRKAAGASWIDKIQAYQNVDFWKAQFDRR